MSILYLVFIEHTWVDGVLYLGRFADLLQLDIIIFLLWRLLRYARLRWHYIKDKE